VFPWKSAVSFTVVCLAALMMLLPLAITAPPEDGEVWILQAVLEMQRCTSFLPVLNGEVLNGLNPLAFSAMTALPSLDIATARLVQVALGCLLAAFTFCYAAVLFGLKDALFTGAVLLTSIGFASVYGALNLAALPLTLAAMAFGIFSLAYLGRLPKGFYLVSYILSALALVTGGITPLLFFVLASLLLIFLDLEPSRLSSIHLLPGIVIVMAALITYLAANRILAGPGHALPSLTPGEPAGVLKAFAWTLTPGLPWVFPLIPAFIRLGGPSDQETWRRLLPARIACVLAPCTLLLPSRTMPQFGAVLVPFASTLVGSWIVSLAGQKRPYRSLDALMTSFAGLSVFVWAFVIITRPAFEGRGVPASCIIGATVYGLAAVLFVFLAVNRRLPAQLFLIGVCSVGVAWLGASAAPQVEWREKAAFMGDASRREPLAVFEDDLPARGLLSAAGARPQVIPGSAVPLGWQAYLVVSSNDMDAQLESLGRRMDTVLVDTVRSGTAYALILVKPRPRPCR